MTNNASISRLCSYLVEECDNSHEFGNDGMFFVDTPECLYEYGFTREDINSLMEDIKRYNLWNVIEIELDWENRGEYADAYITVFGDFADDVRAAIKDVM